MLEDFASPEERMAKKDKLLRAVHDGRCHVEDFKDHMFLSQKVIIDSENVSMEIIKMEQDDMCKKNILRNIEKGNVIVAIEVFKKNPFFAKVVYENLDKFTEEDFTKLTDVIIQQKYGWKLIEHIDCISPEKRTSIMLRCIDASHVRGWSVLWNAFTCLSATILENIHKISAEDQMKVCYTLLNKKEMSTEATRIIARNIGKFDPSIQKQIIVLVVDEWWDEDIAEILIKNIDNIDWLSKNEVLDILSQSLYVCSEVINKYLHTFTMLDGNIAINMLKAVKGYGCDYEIRTGIEKNIMSFDARYHETIQNALNAYYMDIQ